MRNPVYAASSRSGVMIAPASMTSRCHKGLGFWSAGIVPIRKMIPAATQSRPTMDGMGGVRTGLESRGDAGQVGEQGERRHDATKASKHECSEVLLFEAAERECAAYERDHDRHADHHPRGGRPRFQHSTLRHQPGIDAEIDAEQSERSDRRYGQADCDRKARGLAGT